MDTYETGAFVLFAWNLAVFAMYGHDKAQAKRSGRRVSEKRLLLSAALLGGPGALLGMYVFRHKTKQMRFVVGVPVLIALNAAVLAFALPGGLRAEAPQPVYHKISPREAMDMLSRDAVILLDVRTEAEYAAGHIEGAVLLPDYEVAEAAPAVLPDKHARILVYCRTGRRSELAARSLVDMGYTQVYDFGGIVDWPYETVPGAAG